MLAGGEEWNASSDIVIWGKRWMRILTDQEGIDQAWLALVDHGSPDEWIAYENFVPVPLQFSFDKVQDVIRHARVFTFSDHRELISGGLFPLSRQGQVVGVIGLLSEQSDYFKANIVSWINGLIGIITTELISDRQTETDRNQEYRISRLLQSSLDVRDVLGALFEILAGDLQADALTVLHYVASSGRFELMGTHGLESTNLARMNFEIETGMLPAGIDPHQPLWIEDMQDSGRDVHPINRLDELGFRGYLALPLLSKGVLVGALEIAWRAPQHVNGSSMAYLRQIADQVAFAIERTNTIRDLRNSNAQLATRYNAMIEGLSQALELRDLETLGHTRRVSTWTMRLVEHLQMTSGQRDAVRQGALLHDIGKLGIPDAILLKPGSLTRQEKKVMQQHVSYGYNILASITNMRHTLDIILYHHERWDGTGYPHGLTREQIPMMARLFAVVDVFDALTSDRPYRTAWSISQAIEYLKQQSGRQFDPSVVKLFLTIAEQSRA